MRNLVLPGVLLVLLLIAPAVFPKTIDQIIASSFESSGGSDKLADLNGNAVRYEMDMLLTREQAEAFGIQRSPPAQQDDPGNVRKRRKAIRNLSARWTNNVIPYTIASVYNRWARNQISSAIEEWQKYTCLRFRKAKRNDYNRIYFYNGEGCSSWVGMLGNGSQSISLARGCFYKGIIIHEIGHAVGFYHEQNRPDRDDYVTIFEENVKSQEEYNFDKLSTDDVDTMGVPYDYSSVMHYGGRDFTRNEEETIKTKDPKAQNIIGNRKGLSFNDIWLANLMYNCNDHCDQRIECPRGAFLGKDCKCWCPGYPVKECASKGTVPRTTGSPTITAPRMKCGDRNKYCPAWAKAGYCRNNMQTRTDCKLSCGFCSRVADCKDLGPSCEKLGKRGHCSGINGKLMRQLCPKTCKVCGSNIRHYGEDIQDQESVMITAGPGGSAESAYNMSFAATISYTIFMILTKLF